MPYDWTTGFYTDDDDDLLSGSTSAAQTPINGTSFAGSAPTQQANSGIGNALLGSGQAPAAGSSGSTLAGVNKAVGSPLGQLAIGGTAAALSAYANHASQQDAIAANSATSEADREERRQEALASMQNALLTDSRNRATAAVRPLGDAQAFSTNAAKTNMIADMLGQPVRSGTPGIAALQPNISPSAETIGRLKSTVSPEAVAAGLARQENDLNRVDPGRTSTLGTDASTYAGLQPDSPYLASLLQTDDEAQKRAKAELDQNQSYSRNLIQQALGTTAAIGSGQTTAPGSGSAASPFSPQRVPVLRR